MLLIKEADERLSALYETYGHMTVKELTTGTGNIALPTMVQAKAILAMTNFVDLREVAQRVVVPKGAGKTIETQVFTQPTYADWVEGTAHAAADPTVAKKSITLVPFGKTTLISDLLANTSAYNVVESIGALHGGCIMQGILDKIVDGMAGAAAPNNVEIGGSAAEDDFDLSEVGDAISQNLVSGFRPDFIVTAPDKLWAAFTTDYAVTQFTGALSDLLLRGEIPKALGLQWYMDPYFELAVNDGAAWDGTEGEIYGMVGTKGVSAIWAALQDVPEVAVERLYLALSSAVVTHMDGGADEGPDTSICTITLDSGA